MKRKLYWMIAILAIAALVFSTTAVATAQRLMPPPSETGLNIAKPEENSPAIEVSDKGHLVLPAPERVIFIHHKKDFAKPLGAGKGKKEGEGGYKLLGKGVEWKELPIDYVIGSGLSESAISLGAKEWDAHTGTDLFGTYTVVNDATWDGDYGDVPDGRNELLFGNYPQQGVIAVTVVWGYFSGPPGMREIIEFDVLFDTDFTWGDADPDNDGTVNNPNIMDLQNIATHEIGHGVGLADLYDPTYRQETMYGYSDYGEIIKRTLHTGDIAGIQELYGL